MPATTTAQDVTQADGTKVTLAVSGMSCGKCADKITTALRALEGVNAANVDSDSGKAEIAFDAAKVDIDALIAKIAEAGHFTAQKAES